MFTRVWAVYAFMNFHMLGGGEINLIKLGQGQDWALVRRLWRSERSYRALRASLATTEKKYEILSIVDFLGPAVVGDICEQRIAHLLPNIARLLAPAVSVFVDRRKTSFALTSFCKLFSLHSFYYNALFQPVCLYPISIAL